MLKRPSMAPAALNFDADGPRSIIVLQQGDALTDGKGRGHLLKKILVVDDERFIRILLEETFGVLRKAGVEVLSAKDGNEALQLAMLERPDLVILDIMMPRIDGYEVCRRLREELALDDTYIIMLTAKGQSQDRLRGLRLGANEYLTKPFDPDYLITRATELLQLES